MSLLIPDPIKFTTLAQFQPKQLEAWYTLMLPECKYFLYGGAAAGGKSYWLRWAAIGIGMYYYAKYGFKHVPIGLFSEDYPTLKDRQVIKIKNEIPPSLGRLVESRDEGYAFISSKEYGEFIILLRNLDDPSKYASTEFAAEFVEELTKNNKEKFDDLRFRLRYPGIEDVKFAAATNPGEIGHGFVKKLWVKPDPSDPDVEQERFFFVPAKYDDNKFVSANYVKQLDALPENKRRAYKEGDWDVFAGQFFSEWKDYVHIIKPFTPDKRNIIVGGMDWGRTAPFAFHLTEVSIVNLEGTKFHRAKTFLEVYGTDKTPKVWSDIIKSKVKVAGLKLKDITWIQGDPAMFTKGQDNSISIADQFKREGIRIKPASNDRVGGWENLHNWLSIGPDGIPYWQIGENCVNLIRTLPELVHDENKVEDVDTEGEDHAPDDQRYQFKALKWIDGKVGGIVHTPIKQNIKAAQFIDDKQVGINLDKFTTPNAPTNPSGRGGIIRN